MTTLTRSIDACPSTPSIDRRINKRGKHPIDHTGDRFGRLVVVERVENRFKQVTWLCRCDCGGTNIVPGTQLRRGQVRSCGCICRGGPHGKPIRGHNGSHPRPAGSIGLNSLLSIYQSNARKRNLEWGLSHDHFVDLVRSNCIYCGREPKAKKQDGSSRYILYTGIDRFDNTVGYTPSNAVPCCRECNVAKHAAPVEKFFEWLLSIAVRYHANICGGANSDRIEMPICPPGRPTRKQRRRPPNEPGKVSDEQLTLDILGEVS